MGSKGAVRRRCDSTAMFKKSKRMKEVVTHTVFCWRCVVAERSELTDLLDLLFTVRSVRRQISETRFGGVVATL